MRTYLGMPLRKVVKREPSGVKLPYRAYAFRLTLACGHSVIRTTKRQIEWAYCGDCR